MMFSQCPAVVLGSCFLASMIFQAHSQERLNSETLTEAATLSSTEEFQGYAEAAILHQLNKRAIGRKIFVVGFLPNDFLRMSGFENWRWLKHRSNENKFRLKALKSESPFLTDRLSANASATMVYTQFAETKILGHLIWRHESKQRAVLAFEEMFGCKKGRSEFLQEVFLIGAGGSHGGAELKEFEGVLKKKCGKELDLVYLADAIAQPLAFAMAEFPLKKGRLCLASFQQEGGEWIQGGRVQNCESIQIKGRGDGHVSVSNNSYQLPQALLQRLKMDSSGYWVLSDDVPEYFYFSKNESQHQMEFKSFPYAPWDQELFVAGRDLFNRAQLLARNP